MIRNYCQINSVHGFVYLSEGHIVNRLFWALVILIMFLASGYLIRESSIEWEENPIMVNFGLTTKPITDVPVSEHVSSCNP